MRSLIGKSDKFLALPLDLMPRGLLLAAALLLIPCYLFPLWQMTMFAPQYPDGLRMDIYSYKLDGGNGGQDVEEINVLNHYIGMKDLGTADFTEFKWMPFVIGAMGLLFLRAALLGRMIDMVDVCAIYGYFALFSLWSFAYKMHSYGHNLSPKAAVRVDPFMPPMFGHRTLANFEVYSFPGLGSYALGLVGFILGAAFLLAWNSTRAARTVKPGIMT
jgi:hypothetical protein